MAHPVPAQSADVAKPELVRGTAHDRARRAANDDRRQLARSGIVAAIFFVVAVALILVARALRSDDPAATAIARRELQLNSLKPGEESYRIVPVFRRSAIDYFRATRGVVALTNRRLLYLGLRPHELFAPADAPPTFEENDFPLDSTLRMKTTRSFFGLGQAVNIHSDKGSLRLDVPASAEPTAGLLTLAIDVRRERAVAQGEKLRQLAQRADEERKAAEADARKPKYYTVRRGDALASVATRWNTLPDSLRVWNHLPNNKIRVGQVLLVKPQT